MTLVVGAHGSASYNGCNPMDCVWPISLWYGYVWHAIYLHIPNFVLSKYLCMQRLINLRLPNFWDVTFMVSERSFLSIYGLVCLLSQRCVFCVAS